MNFIMHTVLYMLSLEVCLRQTQTTYQRLEHNVLALAYCGSFIFFRLPSHSAATPNLEPHKAYWQLL